MLLSLYPHESIETGSLPDDLFAAYATARRIAKVADYFATCADVPDAFLGTLTPYLEQLEIRYDDVFELLTANAQELNSVRDRPASYGSISHANAHLVAFDLWFMLHALGGFIANLLGLVPDSGPANR